MSEPDEQRLDNVVVTEHGYGLGPANGILVQRHSPTSGSVSIRETRDGFRHQLFWAESGWLAVRLGARISFAGPGQAVWLRRGASAEIRSGEGCDVYAVYLREQPAAAVSLIAGLLDIDPQARDAIVRLGRGRETEEVALGLRSQLLTGLRAARELPHRGDGSGLARHIASALMSNPGDETELNEWARRLHVSRRTLQRDFLREYQATWSVWRARHRLAASIPLLELHSVTQVAHLVGYATASAYVAAFRREYGTTPGALASAHPEGDRPSVGSPTQNSSAVPGSLSSPATSARNVEPN